MGNARLPHVSVTPETVMTLRRSVKGLAKAMSVLLTDLAERPETVSEFRAKSAIYKIDELFEAITP